VTGYGFIDFINQCDAQRALDSASSLLLRGKPLRVNWAIRNKKLFVTGMTPITAVFWSTEVLPLFAEYGRLDRDNCRLILNTKKPPTGTDTVNYCGGVVAFMLREDADRARIAIDGLQQGLTKLSVKWEQSLPYTSTASFCTVTASEGGATPSTTAATTTATSNSSEDEVNTEKEEDETKEQLQLLDIIDLAISSQADDDAVGGVRKSPLPPSPATIPEEQPYTELPHFSVHIAFKGTQVS
jgi:hypothetical protein